MVKIRKCKHCHQEFNMDGKIFSNHVRWCEKNPKSKNTIKISEGVNRSRDNKFGAFKEFEVKCEKCQKKVVVKEREKRHPERKKYFCSRKCSNTRVISDETKSKISKSLKFNGKGKKLIERHIIKCAECNKDFVVKITSKKRFCCKNCWYTYSKSEDEYLAYKAKCQFKFNVWHYQDEFDLKLIYQYGWYKASNRGNNLSGVSRDHKISINYGWQNNISSEIIAHPANCKLMIHNDNVSKHKKCSILLEELLSDIDKWQDKYKKEDI